MAKIYDTRFTVLPIDLDWRWLDYNSEALTKNRQSKEIIEAKLTCGLLIKSSDCPINAKDIVTMYRFKGVARLIKNQGAI